MNYRKSGVLFMSLRFVMPVVYEKSMWTRLALLQCNGKGNYCLAGTIFILDTILSSEVIEFTLHARSTCEEEGFRINFLYQTVVLWVMRHRMSPFGSLP